MSMFTSRDTGPQGKIIARFLQSHAETPRTLGAVEWLQSEANDFVADEKEALESLCHLTLTERAVLDLVAQGKLNKQIAHQCGMAQATVKAHVTAILRKLSVRTRTEAAVRYAVLTDRLRFDR